EIRLDSSCALDGNGIKICDRPPDRSHNDMDRSCRMIRCNLAFRQLRQWPPFGLDVDEKLLAGFQNQARAGLFANDQIVVSRISAGCVTFKTNRPEGKGGAGSHCDRYRHRPGMVKSRVDGKLV